MKENERPETAQLADDDEEEEEEVYEEEYEEEEDALERLTEEQVMDYAEQGFLKLADFLRKNKLIVRDLFGKWINKERVEAKEEGEEAMALEYLKPTDFIDVLR